MCTRNIGAVIKQRKITNLIVGRFGREDVTTFLANSCGGIGPENTRLLGGSESVLLRLFGRDWTWNGAVLTVVIVI